MAGLVVQNTDRLDLPLGTRLIARSSRLEARSFVGQECPTHAKKQAAHNGQPGLAKSSGEEGKLVTSKTDSDSQTPSAKA